MKCLYCGKEFTPKKGPGRPKKYCSNECTYNAYVDNKRIHYVGKRLEFCQACGKPLPKYKTRWCSKACEYNKRPKLKKICCVCGKEFETYREKIVTCSSECSKIRKREQHNLRDRQKYKEEHPEARTMDEILKTSQERKKTKQREAAERKAQRDAKLQKTREKKAKEKQKRIDYWQNYCQLHECAECGQMYVAHYPLSRYCSEKCSRAKYKRIDRYQGITVDKGITLKKLARRDKDICALCGESVDWSDFVIREDGTVICGDDYPSIDHIMPISKGGLHSWANVQLAHRGCNTFKSDKEQVT